MIYVMILKRCLTLILVKVRKLEEMSYTLKNMFDFRPRTDEDGSPNHWRPYVLPDDEEAWFHKPEKDE